MSQVLHAMFASLQNYHAMEEFHKVTLTEMAEAQEGIQVQAGSASRLTVVRPELQSVQIQIVLWSCCLLPTQALV